MLLSLHRLKMFISTFVFKSQLHKSLFCLFIYFGYFIGWAWEEGKWLKTNPRHFKATLSTTNKDHYFSKSLASEKRKITTLHFDKLTCL